MGYGSQALQLVINYYEGKFPNLREDNNEMDTSKLIEKVINIHWLLLITMIIEWCHCSSFKPLAIIN